MARYIVKCPCGVYTSALSEGQNARRSKSDPLRVGGVYTGANGGFYLECRRCGRPRKCSAKMVRGKFSAKHECGTRCMESIGFVCECSCGGKNHGGAYSAS